MHSGMNTLSFASAVTEFNNVLVKQCASEQFRKLEIINRIFFMITARAFCLLKIICWQGCM